MNNKKTKMTTQSLVLTAVLTALVAVLQSMGAFIHFGPFSVSLVLVPIIIGAAKCGIFSGAWLGMFFGLMVFATGDAAWFLTLSVPGTILTVMLKGILCGVAASIVYKLIEKRSIYLAVFCAALVCPLVNTGVFILGCKLFFLEGIAQIAEGMDVWAYIIYVMVGFNFLFELATNLILCPAVVRLLDRK